MGGGGAEGYDELGSRHGVRVWVAGTSNEMAAIARVGGTNTFEEKAYYGFVD